MTAANEQDRAQVKVVDEQGQEGTGENGEIAGVEQAYTGKQAVQEAAQHGIPLAGVTLPEAKRGFVLLPRRWVVERSFAWTTRLRRLMCDDECLPESLADFPLLAFALLILKRVVMLIIQSA